jgi:hypothetical protein
VIFKDGRIVAAGADVTVPPGITVVDAHGKWVSAGLISGFTQLAIGSYSRVSGLNDASAPSAAVSAAIDISSAINPEGAPLQVDRAAGPLSRTEAGSDAQSLFALTQSENPATHRRTARPPPSTAPPAASFDNLSK